ncbi:hypothetical protein GF420_07875 [candidate division GN15 bacterium]|nr:hypothetical protein [candidate division GN15 bacterium]
METLLGDGGTWLGVLGTVLMTVLGFVARQHLIPFLQVGRRERYARYIATMAEEVIDELRARYPEKEWLKHLDDAVSLLIDITGISPEIAGRAVRAAAARR